MNKNKVYIILILGLLLSNLIMAFYVIRVNNKQLPDPKEIIVERLTFDQNQIAEFDKIIHHHEQEMMKEKDRMKQLKYELYLCLKDEDGQKEADAIIKEIGAVQIAIEHLLYLHFEDIKNLCDTSQLDDFNALVNELAKIFSPLQKEKK